MNKIQYHYTNLAKQIFILICFLYILLRFIIMVEIIVYKIEGYYEATNIPLTLLLYGVLFTFLICLFRGHKFCYSTYDESKLIYHNTLLRTKKNVAFGECKASGLRYLWRKVLRLTERRSKNRTADFFPPLFPRRDSRSRSD